MEAMLEAMLELLRGEEALPVYPSYDAVPVRLKEGHCYAVLGWERITPEEQFASADGEVHAFSMQLRLDVLSPMLQDPREAQVRFETVLLPKILRADGITGEMRMEPPELDLKLRKLVQRWFFTQRGYLLASETEESA